MDDASLRIKMQELAQRAVELARDRFQISLDYSEASLEKVESILDHLHRSRPKSLLGKAFRKGLTDGQIQDIAYIWGAYVGEVIRRRWGGEWTNQTAIEPGAVALHVLESDVFPPSKVYKRLVNGEEDNVDFFYKVLKREFEKMESGDS